MLSYSPAMRPLATPGHLDLLHFSPPSLPLSPLTPAFPYPAQSSALAFISRTRMGRCLSEITREGNLLLVGQSLLRNRININIQTAPGIPKAHSISLFRRPLPTGREKKEGRMGWVLHEEPPILMS